MGRRVPELRISPTAMVQLPACPRWPVERKCLDSQHPTSLLMPQHPLGGLSSAPAPCHPQPGRLPWRLTAPPTSPPQPLSPSFIQIATRILQIRYKLEHVTPLLRTRAPSSFCNKIQSLLCAYKPGQDLSPTHPCFHLSKLGWCHLPHALVLPQWPGPAFISSNTPGSSPYWD